MGDDAVWGFAFMWFFFAWLITRATFNFQADDLVWNIKYNMYCIYLVSCLVSLQVIFHGVLLLIGFVAFAAVVKMVVLDYFEVQFPAHIFEAMVGFVCRSEILYTFIAMWLAQSLISFYLILLVYSKQTTGVDEAVLADRAKEVIHRQLGMYLVLNMMVCGFFAVRAYRQNKSKAKISSDVKQKQNEHGPRPNPHPSARTSDKKIGHVGKVVPGPGRAKPPEKQK